MKNTGLFIDRGFRPHLSAKGTDRRMLTDAGVLFPRSHYKKAVAFPAHTAFEGLRAAVWLPDHETDKRELPIVAVASAKDREDLELRRIESYYIGTIATQEYVKLMSDVDTLPDELFERAEFRLSDYPDAMFDSQGSAICSKYDNNSVLRFFPYDRFSEFLGIERSSRHTYASTPALPAGSNSDLQSIA